MTRRHGTANPLDGVTSDSYLRPALADLDGDQDLDLILGELGGTFSYFENSGSPLVPDYVLRTGAANPLSGYDVGDYSLPTLGDLDGDGDLDLITGSSSREMTYYANIGTTTTPRFSQQVGVDNIVSVVSDWLDHVWYGDHPAPTLGDLDGDGDLDLLVGISGDPLYPSYSRLRFFENIGDRTQPVFAIPSDPSDEAGTCSFSCAVVAPIFAHPTFGDVDNDGDLDVVVSGASGTFSFLENTGTATTPKFIERYGNANPLNRHDLGRYTSSAFGDLDGDGDVDLIALTPMSSSRTEYEEAEFSYFETAIGTITETEASEELLREAVVIDLIPTGGALPGPTQTFVLEIEDNDVPIVSLDAIDDQWEGVGQFTISARLSRPSTNEVIVPVNLGRIAPGEDLANDICLRPANVEQTNPGEEAPPPNCRDSAVIVIPAGSLHGSTTVEVIDDALDESDEIDEQFTVSLGRASNALESRNSTATFRIHDNDPAIYFSDAAAYEGDVGELWIQLRYAINQPITVSYRITPLTAKKELDYLVGSQTGTVVIPPNESAWELVSFNFLPDNIVEGEESFAVELFAPGFNFSHGRGYFPDSRDSVKRTISILDDDLLAVSIQFSSSGNDRLSVSEGVGAVPFVVKLANPVVIPIDVQVGRDNRYDSTSDWDDLGFSASTLRIPAGALSVSGEIVVKNDSKRESKETFGFSALISGTQIAADTAVLTINDNDIALTVPLLGSLVLGDTTLGEITLEEPASFPSLGPLSQDALKTCPTGTLCIYTGVDGLISGGLAFFDGNRNGIHDFLDLNENGQQEVDEPAEPMSQTEVDGTFAFEVPALFDRNSNGRVDEQDGQIVLVGGIDSSTGHPLGIALTAPAGFFAVTPVTTLLNQLIRNHGFSVDDAQGRVLEALGVGAIELSHLNPIAGLLNGDPIATEVFASGVMIQDTVVQISRLIAGSPGSPPYEFVATRVFEDLADKISETGATLNLGVPSVIEAIIEGSLYRSASVLDPALVTEAAAVIAASNQHLESLDGGERERYLYNVAKVQVVAQGTAADALANAAATGESTATLESEFTGEGLQETIAAAQPENVLPPVITISDPSVIETDGNTSLVFTVSLVGASTLPVSVDFATADHQATVSDGDYLPQSGALTWEPGDNTPRMIEVVVNGEADFEFDEELLVILSDANNAALRKDIGVGTILNDDALVFQAPNDITGNISLSMDADRLLLTYNDAVIATGILGSPVPILLFGAPNHPNTFEVSLDFDNPGLEAGVSITGGDGNHDSLHIFDRRIENAIHTVSNRNDGSFDLDGISIQYGGIELVSDDLTPSVAVESIEFPEGSEILLTSSLPVYDAPDEVTYSWSAVHNGVSITTGMAADFSFTPADDGDFVVTLTTSGENRGMGVTTTTIQVDNADPIPAIIQVSQLRLEGTQIDVDASASDPADANDTLTFSYEVYKDGSATAFVSESGVSQTSFSFTPDDNGSYEIALTVTDEDGGSAQVSQSITVDNVEPELALDPVATIDENGIAILTGTIADPGTPDTFTVEIDWGDPSSPNNRETYSFSASGTGSQTFSLMHQYLDDHPTATTSDSYSIHVSLSDDDASLILGGNGLLYLTQFRDYSGSIVSVDSGTLEGTFSTTVSGENGIAIMDSIRIVNSNPISQPGSEYDLAGRLLQENVYANTTLNTLYDGTTDGHYNYAVAHNDFASDFGLFRFELDWSNPVQFFTPTARCAGITYDAVSNTLWTTATTGTSTHLQNYDMTGTLLSQFSIGTRAGYSLAWNPADDSLWIPERATRRLWQYDKSGNLLQILEDPGIHNDPVGAEFQLFTRSTVNSTVDVIVRNVDPVLTLDPVETIDENGTATVSGSVTDVGTLDTHTVGINWGDGMTSVVVVDPETRKFTAGHRYLDDEPTGTASDTYTIEVTLVDDDGGSIQTDSDIEFGEMERLTVGFDGNEVSRGPTYVSSISADGRLVVFESDATNIVPDDTNNSTDVFVYDRETGQTERVSISSADIQANGRSFSASISADGRYVAFLSAASNLVADDTNLHWDVFVHDRLTNQTERVSVDSYGNQSNALSASGADRPSISADGRFVAFGSSATNLVAGDNNNATDVFVHDRLTGQTERISVDSQGNEANGQATQASISADGRFVAFDSLATNLVADDNNDRRDAFVHDRATGQTVRVSVDSTGAEADAGGSFASISADGRYVAFSSLSGNLIVGDTNGRQDIFVHNRQTGETARVSIDLQGVQGNDQSYPPISISADGRYVSFRSNANNLVPGDSNNVSDVFLHDRQTGELIRVSVDSLGNEANGNSSAPALSADGRFITFTSTADNLVSGDTNAGADIFVYDRGSMIPSPVVTVNNVAPVLETLTLDRIAINEEGNLTVSGTFSDPGILDTHEVVIDWGDETVTHATPLPAVTTLFPVSDRVGIDAELDGVFDEVEPDYLYSHLLELLPDRERRFGLEFDLSGFAPGQQIESAVLSLKRIGGGGVNPLEIHGYSGDGSVEVGDMTETNLIAGPLTSSADDLAAIDVTSFVQTQLDAGAAYAGIVLRGTTASQQTQIATVNNPNEANRPTLSVAMAGRKVFSTTHTYFEVPANIDVNGQFTITATVTDDDNESDSATTTVNVFAAINDVAEVTEDGPAFSIDVQANDSDADSGETVTVAAVDTTGTLGLVTINPDGTISYDPNGQFEQLGLGETATDSFVYTLTSSTGASDTGTVTVTITGAADTLHWQGDVDTLWSVPENWLEGQVPRSGDSLVFDFEHRRFGQRHF